MILIPDLRTSPAALTVETVRGWQRELSEAVVAIWKLLVKQQRVSLMTYVL